MRTIKFQLAKVAMAASLIVISWLMTSCSVKRKLSQTQSIQEVAEIKTDSNSYLQIKTHYYGDFLKGLVDFSTLKDSIVFESSGLRIKFTPVQDTSRNTPINNAPPVRFEATAKPVAKANLEATVQKQTTGTKQVATQTETKAKEVRRSWPWWMIISGAILLVILFLIIYKKFKKWITT